MKHRLLPLLISSVLIAPLAAHAQAVAETASAEDQAASSRPRQLDAVQVTGSLIPRAQVEGPSPVTTITAEQIQAQGFTTVFDALRSLPVSNGSVQDSQGTGFYTPGAKTISLFGLDPSYTLTLINGRPINSYPLAYNGNTSIADIANIPLGMVERIDVLTGGQSSVYGSSAVAGVVNIVLKDRVEGTHLRYRVGGYSQGGGSSQRFSFSSGQSFGNLDLSYGLEYTNQKAIHAFNRSSIDSVDDNPTGPQDPSRTFLRMQMAPNAYIDPGAATCAPLAGLFGGSTVYAHRDIDGGGYYCGSPENVGTATLYNTSQDVNATTFLRYHLTPETELYSDILFGFSRPTYSGGSPFWSKTFYNQSSGQYEQWQRIYAPEEVGLDAKDQRVYTRSLNVTAGVRGALGGFDYDVYANRSSTDVTRKSTDFLARNGVDDYYLGPMLGMQDGYEVYAPDLSRLYQPITRGQYDSFSGLNRAASSASRTAVTALLTHTALFSMPAGDVGFALIAQGQREKFFNQSADPDAGVLFRGQTGGTSAEGQRDLYALGAELQVPIIDTFSANLSGRYDKYSLQGGGGNGKATWKLGLEYRPVESLLLRGSYATAFRSPDMFYLFSRESSGYTTNTDLYQCRQAGYTSDNFDECAQSGLAVLSSSTGNRDLKDITARTFTYGVVWSALDNALSVSVDFNSVTIENEVRILGTDSILDTEANCRLGVSENGQTRFDISSPTCQQVLGQVQRKPATDPLNPNGVDKVFSYPINIASQRQTGVQAALDYRWATQNAGDFSLNAGYYRSLKHTTQDKEGDPVHDQLCCANSNELQHRTTLGVNWNRGPFSASAYGVRNAPTWNQEGERRDIGPWTTWNATVGYRINELASLLLTVNNVTDEMPPIDRSNGNWPFYDQGIYNAFGRSAFLELSLDFQ